jgi:hypothetical protein
MMYVPVADASGNITEPHTTWPNTKKTPKWDGAQREPRRTSEHQGAP